MEIFPFFAVTTREQPQEGRVETVNCVMDGVCVCVLLRVNASLNEFPTHRLQMPATDIADLCVCVRGSNSLQIITV